MKHLFQTVTLTLLFAGLIFYSCKKERRCESCETNQPTSNSKKLPIAFAGTDQTVTLPTDSILLDGTGSNDADGSIIGWQWMKISGPSSFTIVNPTHSKTQVHSLAEGIYLFELKITDNDSLSANDTMEVTVNRQANNSPVDVYVTGYNGYNGLLWKNGVVQTLLTAIPGSYASSVFASGNDVYVAGVASNGSLLGMDAILWKNGVEQNFGGGWASSVFISGSDVYVAGSTLWKNGIVQTLDINAGSGNSVFVSGSDVYVAGEEWDASGNKALLWKNGVKQNLGSGSAHSVFVSGSDVYVAGTSDNVATVWKNGQATSLGIGVAQSVFVSGSDVYVAGTAGNVATVWKNGQATSLGTGVANSVFVSDSNVYVAGRNGSIATLWKNGVANSLQGLSEALSVFVK